MAILSVVAFLLLLANIVGVRVGGGSYDAGTGGSLADWFEAMATLVAVPVAVLVGVRQLRSSGEALELGRRRIMVEEMERLERARADQARVLDALRVQTRVANVVDQPDLASEAERAATARLREELRLRGWECDEETGAWQRHGERCSNAEVLALEPSPLAPKPWFAVVECANHGTATVTLRRWTVIADGTSTSIECWSHLRPGAVTSRRLGQDVGCREAYAKPADVEARLASLVVELDGCDAADRDFQIVATRE